MEIRRIFWIPDITDWWHKQAAMHWKCIDSSNVACDIFSIIPHGGWVEASFSLWWDVIGWRQSKTAGKTFHKKVNAWQFARANHGILVGGYPALDMTNTENYSDMMGEVEDSTLHSVAKVYDFLKRMQHSENLRATRKESRTWKKQMTAVGYILDTEDTVKAYWSLLQHDVAAALKLSERSLLPPALSAKNLWGGRIQILHIQQLRWFDCHPVEWGEDCACESSSETENWLNWNAGVDNWNGSEDDCMVDVESDIEEGNTCKDPETTEQQDVSAAPNVPGLIWPT